MLFLSSRLIIALILGINTAVFSVFNLNIWANAKAALQRTTVPECLEFSSKNIIFL
jgi:type IV secretory pathway TrbD component